MNRRSFLKSLLFLFASLSLKIFPTEKTKTIAFNYGVASGDPTNTKVILWTKISGGDLKDKKIKWEVSNQKSFQKILVSGNAKAKFDDNFTVKVDAQIPSNFNGKTIYYRFSCQGIVSDIGTTKTLPINNPNKFNIAFCSCSNYPAGYFNAYKEMANDEEVDLVLHLGDYLYEYSREGYASSDAKKMGRVVNPPNEIISLDDYRKRYATYRSDTDLQLLHQSKPMIAVWDDHEITNDTWKKGAQNHSPDEGSFYKRKNNAIKAYYEWMPIRDTNKKEKIWRKFKVGNLINLVMLDTRLYGRDKQLEISSYIKDEVFDKVQYKKDLNKPRNLLGREQLNWVNKSVSKDFKWSIFGQQLLIGPKYLPNIFKSEKLAGSRSYLTKQLAGEKLATNTDQWDGYPKEREKFYQSIMNSQSNIILAGDSHNSWFSNLYDKNKRFVGIEVGAPAISSPSFGDSFKEATESVEKAFIEENRDLIWVNGKYKGYVSMDIYENYIDVNFKYITTVKSRNYQAKKPITFRVEHNKPYAV